MLLATVTFALALSAPAVSTDLFYQGTPPTPQAPVAVNAGAWSSPPAPPAPPAPPEGGDALEAPPAPVAPAAPPAPPVPPVPPAPVAAGALTSQAAAPAAPAVPAVPAVPAAPRSAAAPQAPKAPPAPPAPAAPAAPAAAPAPPAPPAPPVPPAQLVNVQVDVTVSDQLGTAAPLVRSISATAGDGERASVRSNSEVKTTMGFRGVGLALDIRPRLVGPTKVRVEIGLDTSSVNTEGAAKDVSSLPSSKTTQSVVLESGRSVVLSQTVDPLTERKTTIEVKATILK